MCLKLECWVMIIGCLEMVASVVVPPKAYLEVGFSLGFFILILLVWLFYVICCFLLVYGIIERHYVLIKPWLVLQAVLLIIYNIFAVKSIFDNYEYLGTLQKVDQHQLEEARNSAWWSFLIDLFIIMINIYFWACVCLLFVKKSQEKRELKQSLENTQIVN